MSSPDSSLLDSLFSYNSKGTIAPTTAPNFVSLPDAGGCPLAYSRDEKYEAGDKV
jgi:hypothetical protein